MQFDFIFIHNTQITLCYDSWVKLVYGWVLEAHSMLLLNCMDENEDYYYYS